MEPSSLSEQSNWTLSAATTRYYSNFLYQLPSKKEQMDFPFPYADSNFV